MTWSLVRAAVAWILVIAVVLVLIAAVGTAVRPREECVLKQGSMPWMYPSPPPYCYPQSLTPRGQSAGQVSRVVVPIVM
jgi:hypothetical protein